MRYGNPNIKLGLEKLRKQRCRRILVLPLYPQYCAATTGSTFDKVTEVLRRWRWIPEIRFVNNYFENPLYIDCLIKSIRDSWKKLGKSQKLIFSYHGIPKKYLLKGDPYHCFCQKTTRLVVEKMKLKKEEYITTFQSRFGSEEWLKPYTDKTLKELPSKGIKKIHILSPGFSSDCLETLEELEVENKEKFTGCTVHLVNSRLDSGKIILQKKIKILRKDNENSLAKKVLKLEHQLYPRAIVKFLSSR